MQSLKSTSEVTNSYEAGSPIRASKQSIICLVVLVSETIIARIFLIMGAPSIYGQDAYGYLSEAMDFASNGAIQIKAGLPFVFFLAISLKIFGSSLGVIMTSRLFMLFMSSLLTITIYSIGLRMAGRVFGLLAALLASVEPYLLVYSIVPHNDVFAITIGLMALYFAISSVRISRHILAPVFFYLAIFTRPELFLALVVPMLVLYFWKNSKMRQTQDEVANVRSQIAFAFLVYVIPSILLYQYAQPFGRLGIMERIILFLKPELLRTAFESSLLLYGQPFLDQAISVLIALGLLLAILNKTTNVSLKKENSSLLILLRYKKVRRFKEISFSENTVIALCLFLFFILFIITLTLWGFSYEWAFYVSDSAMSDLNIVRQALIIMPTIHDRYLIPVRLLVSYPLAYPLFLATKKGFNRFAHKE